MRWTRKNSERPRLRGRLAPALALALAGLVVGCTPDFENSTTVKDLRMLAVVTEPPEILIDLPAVMQDPTLLAGLPSVEVTPLVVDPHGGGRPVDYQVVACENQPDDQARGANQGPGQVRDTISEAPCPEGSVAVASGSAIAGPDGIVPIELTFTPTADLLVRGVQADPLSLELGLPITLSFTVRAGDEQVVAIKRVLFTPRVDADQMPNRNPQIAELTFSGDKSQPFVTLDPASPPTVNVGAKLLLAPAGAQAEAYRARAFSTSQRQFIIEDVPAETLRYAFYATAGIFSPGSVSSLASPLLTDPHVEIQSTYEAPAQLPEDPGEGAKQAVEIFVVVRDERGGSSFMHSHLQLQGTGP